LSRSIRAEKEIEFSPYNHHLQDFLNFLKKERGFADATIINRKRSLRPFLAWLVAQGVPLPAVSPVVITRYFTGIVAGRWKRTHRLVSCTVSAVVFSLCQQPRLVRGGHRRVHRCTPGLHVRKSAARAVVGRGEEPSCHRQKGTKERCGARTRALWSSFAVSEPKVMWRFSTPNGVPLRASEGSAT
jgi:hypothetical protein